MFTITSVGQELHARTVCKEGQYITEQTFQSESGQMKVKLAT